jgi:hypothetical protein
MATDAFEQHWSHNSIRHAMREGVFDCVREAAATIAKQESAKDEVVAKLKKLHAAAVKFIEAIQYATLEGEGDDDASADNEHSATEL